jgi:hypothetical protein
MSFRKLEESYVVPEHYCVSDLVVNTVDHGGDGDCLIRCLRNTKRLPPTLPATEQLYEGLGLPVGSFLEDVHLTTLGTHFSFDAVVLRVSQTGAVIQHYNLGGRECLYLVNYYPAHFVEAHFTYSDGQTVDFTSPRLFSEEMWNIEIDGTVHTYNNLLFQAEHALQPDLVEDVVLPPSVLVPTNEVSKLYSYLLDTNLMSVSDKAIALDMFYQLHHVLLDFLIHCQSQHLIPPTSLFKAYYKFRHNIFSALCLINKGYSVPTLGTDMSLQKWLPLSNKTPDYVFEDEKNIVLWEFTVGNTYESVDFHKGGGNYDYKYSHECSMIQKVSGKQTSVRVVPCVLNQNNVDEILSLLNLPVDKENRAVFADFMNIANKNKSQISHSYSASSFASQTVQEPDLHMPVTYPRSPIPKIQLFDAEFLSKLVANNDSLYKRAVGLATTSRKKLILCYDIDSSRFFFTNNIKGLDPDWWCEVLKKKMLSTVLSALRYFSQNKEVSKENVRGTVPVMTPHAEPIYKPVHWAADSYLETIYESDRPVYQPGYGDPGSLSEADMLQRFTTDNVAFPPDYMDQLIALDTGSILSCKSEAMLANCHVTHTTLESAIDDFGAAYKDQNSQFVFRPKQTFMVPLVTEPMTHVHLDELPNEMFETYIQKGQGKYTSMILSKAVSGKFIPVNKPEFTEAVKESLEHYRRANCIYYEKLKSMGKTGFTKWSEFTDDERSKLMNDKRNVVNAQKAYRGLLKGGRSTVSARMVKVVCKKNSVPRAYYDAEMEHFGNTGRYGVGSTNTELDNSIDHYFNSFAEKLFQPGFHQNTFPELFSTHRSVSPQLLTSIKNMYTDRWNIFADAHFRGTLCEQLTFLASNLANFLFAESVKNHNSDFVKIDNLGFSDFAVICRGGPKIFKNQTSKLYRVMFYIGEEDLKFSGYAENPTFEVIRVADRIMIVSPWSAMRQDIIFDYLSLPYTTFNSLYSSYTRTYTSFEHPVPKLLALPVMLALHNRRKTESFMHNCRYLVVNLLGENANLKGIIKGFATFNYTYLDCWLKNRIRDGYLDFSRPLLQLRGSTRGNIERLLDQAGVKDLWFSEPVTTADQLTLFIYITYMMSKAPVNGSIEQATNLWEVLEDVSLFEKDHKDVDGMKDESLRSNVLEFDPTVYDDDFKYDPVFCQYQGHYLAGYLSSVTSRSELECAWERIENEDLGAIANSNGLRGWDNNNFFGKKGYEVVYNAIESETSPDQISELFVNYLESDHITAANSVASDHVNLIDTEGFDKLLFHIVHKIQRGGNREIYCMDLNTKRKQYPIEKFFKHICKLIPNEFISIPSNKRHNMIHSDFYEKPIGPWVKTVKRWVLDCRRWAPHSIFQKYVHFVKGLSPLLPAGFVNHFYKFAEGMMIKKFVTREHVINKMRNNVRFEKYANLIEKDPVIFGAYTFCVKFSFVMGIFNYLSTALHAANQLVASEVIRLKCLNEGYGLVVLDPKCHSDDSVVTSYHEDPRSVRLTVLLYDWLLKNTNHMLSVKKSQINNNVYLEFLSVLYLFDRLLPVYPKFTSTMPFKPSDNGYASDLSFCVTQGLELLSQGGSFEECFLICKTTERFIQSQYMLDVSPDLPPQLMGQFDSHPLELVYLGGMADLVRWYKYNPDSFWRCYNNLWDNEILDRSKNQYQLDWDMAAHLQQGQLLKMDRYSQVLDKTGSSDSWTVANCKLGNGKLNLLWYLNKLRDRKFRSTLLDEPVSRRYSRILGSARYRQIRTCKGLQPVGTVSVIMSQMDKIGNPIYIDTAIEQLMEFFSGLVSDFYDALEGTTIGDITHSNVKEKPILFIKETHPLAGVQLSYSEYVSYKKEPNHYKLLGKRSNPARQCDKIDDYLKMSGVDPEKLGVEALALVARRILSHSETQMRLVTTTHGASRVIKDLQSVMSLLSYNSLAHQKVEFRNHSAAAIDWSKKSMVGAMPQAAIEYVKNYWVCRQITDYGIEDLDIYDINPLEKERELVDSLSTEWKIILLSALESEGKPLESLSYWCYWQHEQVKLGHRWFGHGVCILNTPECVLRLTCDNGILQKLEVDTDYHGHFSNSTSWYLHNYFNHSGMNVEVISAGFAEPDRYYLGYNSSNHSYGYHRASMFDYIVVNQVASSGLMPAFAFSNLPRKRVYNHYIYQGEKDYYVDFFVPTESPTAVGFKGVFDLDKLVANKNNDKLKLFMTDMAVDTGELLKVDKKQLADDIANSTWYRMLYQSELFPKLLNQEKSETTLVNAIMEWKKVNPKFGFPNEEEIDRLLKSSNSAPFPAKIMEALLKLGKSNMPETDFTALITILASMQNEERMSYMMNNFGFISSDLRADALVMAIRSDRIYSCSKVLGRDIFKILMPLVSTICRILSTNVISSPTLTRLVKSLNMSLNKRYSASGALQVIFCQLIICNFARLEFFSPETKLQTWLLRILSELWDEGLPRELNKDTVGDQILRSIEFNVPWETFCGWVVDLLDNFCHLNINRSFKIDFHKQTRAILGENSTLAPMVSDFRGVLVKMKSNPSTGSLRYQVGDKNYTLSLCKKHQIDTCRSEPQFLNDDGQNEYDLGHVDEEDEDLLPYCDLRDPSEVLDYAYVTTPIISMETMVRLRGSARNLFVHGFEMFRDIKDLYGHVRYFKAKRSNSSLINRIQSEFECLLYVGKKLKNLTISGFVEMSKEEFWKYTQRSKYTNDLIEVAGKTVTKKEFYDSPMLLHQYESIGNYFRRLTAGIVVDEAKKIGKQVNTVLSDHYISPILAQKREQLANIIGRMNRKIEEEGPDTVVGVEQFNLVEIAEEIFNAGDIIAAGGNKEYVVFTSRLYNYQETAALLVDIGFKSEINAFFPEYVDDLFNGNVRISARTKKRVRTYIDGQIRQMQKELKPKYKKLKILVESIFTMAHECNFRQNESFDFVSLIDDLFDIDLDTEEEYENMADYVPGDGATAISFDFAKIFGL